MTTISLCMIVRDEAAQIPAFLRHVQGCYDQLVVVDTGSRDGTADLFRAAGAEVHEQPWADDFARARNESLRHARCDWVLVLDADEYPQAGFAAELRAFVARPEMGAANVLVQSPQANGLPRTASLLRLFRRGDAVAYRCRIHEEVASSVRAHLAAAGQRLETLRTPVLHLGYLPEFMSAKDKQSRDERLLRLAMADDPHDLYSRYKLLELYRYWGGREADAMPVARDCAALIAQGVAIQPPHVAGDLADLLRAALYPDGSADGIAFLQRLAPVAGMRGQYHVALGNQYEHVGQADAAARAFTRALDLLGDDPACMLIETRAVMGLARLALARYDVAAAKALCQRAAAIAPDDAEVALLREFLSQI